MSARADVEPPAEAVALARRLGAVGDPDTRWRGATATVFGWPQLVVKVADDRDDARRAVRVDARVSQWMAGVGVAVPRLLALEDRPDRPLSAFERLAGLTLAEVGDGLETWREVGRMLAVVHAVPSTADLPPLRRVVQSPALDPRPWLRDAADRGRLSRRTARRAAAVLEGAADAVLRAQPVLCHGDVNATNVVLTSRGPVLLDWAGAGWLDPVWDLAAIPASAATAMLAGHRERASFPDDATAEARLTWVRLQAMLHRARDGDDDLDDEVLRLLP